MKKEILVLAIICSLIVAPFSTSSADASQETSNPYPILQQYDSNNNTGTINKNSNENLNKQTNKKHSLSKKRHNKKVKMKSSRNSNTEWNIQAIKADTISNNSAPKVKVALIDSGVDYSKDIDVYKRKNFIPGEDEVSALYEDGSGHGTSVAGIIAAKENNEGITGINSNVELYSAKVLDSTNKAPIDRVVQAVYWAIENNVNIINISFGTTTNSPLLKQAIQDAYNAGILIIAAAGNNGTIEYPAAYDEVIAVGSVNSKGERSTSSATGEALELMAPGEQILSTGAFGGICVTAGTSMAAPHVTGIASVLWQKDLSCTSDFIRKLLDVSANAYGNVNDYGYGLIDLNHALNIYDEFKNMYTNEITSSNSDNASLQNDTALTNTSEVPVFSDVDYVTGSWATEKHADLAGLNAAGSTTGLSAAALAVVKLGARAPDSLSYNIKDMGKYPQWHGFTSWTGTDGKTKYCNYMASYIYITKVALGFSKEYTNSNSFTPPAQPAYLSNDDYNMIAGVATATTFSGVSWATVLSGNDLTDRNKRLFMYGTALHTATDLFAHSTYVNGKYLSHEDGCDTWSDSSNRCKCAEQIARILIAHILAYTPGDISDFYQVAVNPYDGTSFKVNNYSTKANLVDSAYYNSHMAAFDSITIKP